MTLEQVVAVYYTAV